MSTNVQYAVLGKINGGSASKLPDPVVQTLPDHRILAAVASGSNPAGFAAHCERLAEAATQRGPVTLDAFAGLVVGTGEAIIQWYGDARVYYLDRQSLRLLTSDNGLFGDTKTDRFLSLFVQPPEPGIFLILTRGAWDCWAAPWLLERALMSAFGEAEDWDQWSASVRGEVEKLTRAGATYAAVPCMATSYHEARDAIRSGSAQRWCDPIQLQEPAADEPDPEPQPQGTRSPWQRYAFALTIALVAALVTNASGPVSAHEDAAHPAVEPEAAALATPTAAPAAPTAAPAAPTAAPAAPGRVAAVAQVASSETRRRRAPAAEPAAPEPTPRRLAATVPRTERRAPDTPETPKTYRYRAHVHVVVRAKAGQNHRRIAVLSPGTEVTVLGRRRGDFWVKIQFGERTGWVAPVRGYLRPTRKFSVWEIPPL